MAIVSPKVLVLLIFDQPTGKQQNQPTGKQITEFLSVAAPPGLLPPA